MMRLPRTFVPALALAGVLLVQSGCSDDGPSGPTPDAPPALPAPERLSFDFSFFQEPSQAERSSKQNFFHAYVRATVASAVTHLILTPPIAAFSLALHTVPSPQDDGSYLWVYTWVDGDEEVQVRLRGKQESDGRVSWEMRASNTEEGFTNELWFEGETWRDGDEGVFRFHDFEREGKPVVASLNWGKDEDGEFLRLEDELDNAGDSLEFRKDGVLHSLTFEDASDPSLGWFVKWNSVDGSGSLRAPDYNGGLQACWDDDQDDVACAVS